MTYADKMDEIRNPHRKTQFLLDCLSALQALAVNLSFSTEKPGTESLNVMAIFVLH